jgi:hypothetical protein
MIEPVEWRSHPAQQFEGYDPHRESDERFQHAPG